MTPEALLEWARCFHSDALSAHYHRCGCHDRDGNWCDHCLAAFKVLDERHVP